MKQLIRKPWFLGIIMIGLIIIAVSFNIAILFSPTSISNLSLWSFADNIASRELISIFALIYKIVMFVSILPILSAILSLIRNKNFGFLFALAYFILFDSLFVALNVFYHHLSSLSLVLLIISYFALFLFVAVFSFRRYILKNKDIVMQNDSSTKRPLKITSRLVLLIDILSIILFIVLFVIPLYSIAESDMLVPAYLINAMFGSNDNIALRVYFLVNLALFLIAIFYFFSFLMNFLSDEKEFIKKSNRLNLYIFSITIVFFLTGLGFGVYWTLIGSASATSAFIPMLIMAVIIFFLAVLIGRRNESSKKITKALKKHNFPRIETLIYAVLMTAIPFLVLLLPIVRISVSVGDFSDNVNMTGFVILRDYMILDVGYRIVAFVLVLMLLVAGLSFVVILASYLAKYRKFDFIVKLVTTINMISIFAISVSGYYFQIAQEINEILVIDILDFYNVSIPAEYSDYQIAIGTDAIYLLIAAAAVLIVMFLRKAFDPEKGLAVETGEAGLDGQTSSGSLVVKESAVDEETIHNFDSTPSFTELDAKVDSFRQDLERRNGAKAQDATLQHLVRFVVDYAKNSRLHLSYTEQDIATFVAGLGTSRLSILQGLSGTGKTSLPKIFTEAIYGNCDVIEVESSWKDKNELLGYYNEFSMKYTPKKFTLALYKAALNPEIMTIIILDEMNLSRIEYYFSDFLSLMENEESQREIKLVNVRLSRTEGSQESDYRALERGHTLKVTPNVWFVGTANRDESTFVISDKVYDRAQTMNFVKRAPKVRDFANPLPQRFYSYQVLKQLFESAKQRGGFDAERNALIKNVEALLAPFNISFGNRILKQIEDFVNVYKACFGNQDVENEAIEKILLSKVVAKLEVKAIDDKNKLINEFERLKLYQCVDFIQRLDND